MAPVAVATPVVPRATVAPVQRVASVPSLVPENTTRAITVEERRRQLTAKRDALNARMASAVRTRSLLQILSLY